MSKTGAFPEELESVRLYTLENLRFTAEQESGASISVIKKLFQAVIGGKAEDLNSILNDPSVTSDVFNATDANGMNIFVHALTCNQEAFLKLIKDSRITPEFARSADLHSWSSLKYFSLALLDSAVSSEVVNAVDASGNNILHSVARFSPEALSYLLADGRVTTDTFNARSKAGKTVLHNAANNPEALRMLLADKRINAETINARDCEGRTVLHIAATNPEALSILLLDKRINAETFNAADNDRRNALHAAAASARSLLMLLGDERVTAEAINATDFLGETPLYEAVLHEKSDSISLLLGDDRLTADAVNARGVRGYNALTRAAKIGGASFCILLGDRRVNINVSDGQKILF